MWHNFAPLLNKDEKPEALPVWLVLAVLGVSFILLGVISWLF